MTSNPVVGYFPTQATAESAISAFKHAGFQQSQIGVALQSAQAGMASAQTATHTEGSHTEASPAYNAGHAAGGAWESVKNFFSGGTAEPYAGEATRETFNDHTITDDDYDAEDVHGSLSGLSVPSEHARYFGHRLGSAEEGAVLTIRADGREQEASDIIVQNGGDLGEGAADYDYDSAIKPANDSRNIKLYGEVLRVHKDRVSAGEVRIRKEVTTTMQTIEVPVTHEELVVERVPVSGEQVGNANFQSEEMRIPLSQEQVNVEKQAVVREEVHIGKKEVTNVEAFDEQVRSEDLKIDQNVDAVKGRSA